MPRHAFKALDSTFIVDSEYEFVKELGHSANGPVVVAKHCRSGVPRAIKMLNNLNTKHINMKRCLREVRLLRHFRGHENILCLYDMDIIFDPTGDFNEVYIYAEIMESDLYTIIWSGQPLTDAHFQYFLYQTLRGLKYIHSANVLHRDLKPSRLLVNAECELKICDFGMVRGHTPGTSGVGGFSGFMTEHICTRWYRAPEVMLSRGNYLWHRCLVCWFNGCILAELLGGRAIFQGRGYLDQLDQILLYLGTPSEDDLRSVSSPKAQDYIRSLPIKPRIPSSSIFPHANPLAIDLLSQMLCFDPTKRISCEQALNHPYFVNYHDPVDEPICDLKFDSGFEEEDTIEGMKRLIVNEVSAFHEEVRAQATAASQIQKGDSLTISSRDVIVDSTVQEYEPPMPSSAPTMMPKEDSSDSGSVKSRSPSPCPHTGDNSNNAAAFTPQPPPFYDADQDLSALRDFISSGSHDDSSTRDQGLRYMPGVQAILKQALDWINNPNISERILWIHGHAIAKTTVARRILYSQSQDKVIATFFFSRSDPHRNDGHRLFPTIARQLATSMPDLRSYIAMSLNEDPNLSCKAIEIQFEQLIARPLREISIEVTQVPLSMPAVIILVDGIDECLNESIQRRILKIIGNAVVESNLPLRFIFLTRPGTHFEEIFDQIHDKTTRIDINVIINAYLVIEEYLAAEFACIAGEQQLDHVSWPGREIIENLTSRSIELIYASTLMKFIGDVNSNAVAQLEIIMRIGDHLDALYLEILKQQQDQSFLKAFLHILVARKCNSQFPNLLGKDDALLLNTDEEHLTIKLHGMHPLLRIQHGSVIDIYHPSFLDFLQEPSRSSEYHVSKQNGTQRYLELVVDALTRRVSRCMEHPHFHEADHFAPEFGNMIHQNPGALELPPQVWEEVLRPLMVQGKLLSFESLKRGYCDRCRFFQIINDLLLHLRSLQETADGEADSSHQKYRPNFGLGFGLASVIALYLARQS